MVHPRARGEHCPPSSTGIVSNGSSPRTRGTPPGKELPGRIGRFIPAHAGNTLRPGRLSVLPAVHPRARGEHSRIPACSDASYGSSPRTRGTRNTRPLQTGGLRFIPAHAGNTRPLALEPQRETVHPRARGEHGAPTISCPARSGSSPRTRGTRERPAPCVPKDRFIPAHAGNTTTIGGRTAKRTVHPRARGEHPSPVTL